MYKETTLFQFISDKVESENKAAASAGKADVSATEARKDYEYPPENLPCLLLSVGYHGEKNCAYVRLYDPESRKLYWWYDNTDHHPYCLSDLSIDDLKKNSKLMSHSGLLGFEEVEKYDLLHDLSLIHI